MFEGELTDEQASHFYQENVGQIHFEVRNTFGYIMEEEIAPLMVDIQSELKRGTVWIEIHFLKWIEEVGQ
jgi:hypothetical protein